jgi:hypothetical protein
VLWSPTNYRKSSSRRHQDRSIKWKSSNRLLELTNYNNIYVYSRIQQCLLFPLVATSFGHFDHHQAIFFFFFFFFFFLQSATTCARFWFVQLLSSNSLYSVLLFSNCVRSSTLYFPKPHFPNVF